ncbi:MAG: hypothetical protein EOP46_12395, partial [Sphingobacteriaceae bacterium]
MKSNITIGRYAIILFAIFSVSISACKKSGKKVNPDNDSNEPDKKENTVTYLDANSNSTDFQTLLNSAIAGDVIILKEGSHYITTPIRLPAGKNNITIRGEKGAVIRKAPNTFNAAAFEITGNYNTIDLIELDGGNLPEAGIIIYGQHNTISNSKIHNCGNNAALGAGILIHNTGTPVCSFNTVIGCRVYYNYMVGVSQNGH